mmetsp:Transcript_22340/g.31271  ORF Transcript_22340/g.31271 Transcript_22340/m.31271 type:complete len:80 (-) Transcript_22340:1277-1516(-)
MYIALNGRKPAVIIWQGADLYKGISGSSRSLTFGMHGGLNSFSCFLALIEPNMLNGNVTAAKSKIIMNTILSGIADVEP